MHARVVLGVGKGCVYVSDLHKTEILRATHHRLSRALQLSLPRHTHIVQRNDNTHTHTRTHTHLGSVVNQHAG